jgi:ABC-type bacteriocin/lantibiotic exporter with double-glycine peptidase domain
VTALTAAQVLAAIAFMFAFSWTLALVFLAAAPVYAALIRFSVRYLRPVYDNLETRSPTTTPSRSTRSRASRR